MSGDGINTTCVITKACKIDVNLCEQNKDFLLSIPLTFPEGPDFDALSYEKFNINSVDVQIKPYDNFTVKDSATAGVLNGDFPVYLNVYTGNTIGDTAPTTLAQFALRGDYKVGSATSGVRTNLGGKWFKTVLKGKPESESQIRESVANKENGFNTIDDLIAESETIVLQKGQISVALRLEDFICSSSGILREGNIANARTPKGNGAVRDTAAERIMEHLKGKSREEEESKPEIKKGRKGKKNTPPSDGDDDLPVEGAVLKEGEEWIADPVQEGNKVVLRLVYAFWLVVSYDITYWRSLTKN